MNSVTKKILSLISRGYTKIYICDELGISRPTLDTRLKLNNWKKSEKALIKLMD